MSNVRSRPLNSAPIDRKHLDTARTPFRMLLGALFVGYSSVGTITGVRGDLAPALESVPDGALIGLIIGFAVALAIFLAEILLAESAFFWYLLVLIPDVWYTYRFSGWIGTVARSRMRSGLTTDATIIALTAVFALAVAYLGERLLFGRRRGR